MALSNEVQLELANSKIASLEAVIDAMYQTMEHNSRVQAATDSALDDLDDEVSQLVDENNELRTANAGLADAIDRQGAELHTLRRALDARGTPYTPSTYPMFLDPGVHSNS